MLADLVPRARATRAAGCGARPIPRDQQSSHNAARIADKNAGLTLQAKGLA